MSGEKKNDESNSKLDYILNFFYGKSSLYRCKELKNCKRCVFKIKSRSTGTGHY